MFLYSPVVRAQQDTVVRCRFETSQIDIGAETIITLEVLDVVDLFAFQLDMAFDADLAEVSGSPGDPEDNRMQLGDFLISDFEVYNEIYNDFGAIFIGLTQFFPSPPQSGSGELAYGYVSGLQAGTVEFIFEEFILLDPDGQEIPHNRENCTLSIGTDEQVTETPTKVFTASPTNTSYIYTDASQFHSGPFRYIDSYTNSTNNGKYTNPGTYQDIQPTSDSTSKSDTIPWTQHYYNSFTNQSIHWYPDDITNTSTY